MSELAIAQFHLVELIRNKIYEVAPWRVETALRLMKVKPLRGDTIEKMRACVAIHLTGFPITTDLFGYVVGIENKHKRYPQATSLHLLGDKNCLMLKRGKRGTTLEWIVSESFMKYYESTLNIQSG